ncbi:hypothetical protein KDW_27900 [Dictyobacter vulcani]|uniref:Uncharacterized protein n=1 Tax=Dictyobacter vulcani TaxID=2607529 RepID=A0A5J4KGB3_9CHLR|nr:hypothetical protein [Dictyobacter vulcani]GER88628.1 hypothetical protein KDW_27900 [Dictyobacter vulcani]
MKSHNPVAAQPAIDIPVWIGRLEQQTADLLAGANVDDLTSKERIDFSLKTLSHIQRLLVINQQLTTANDTSNTDNFLTDLARQMRGEAGPSEIDTYNHGDKRISHVYDDQEFCEFADPR